ncbi:hypothetical protein QT970_21600, partial [Microcoleus sp. herbarium8]|uniref:hypothetical protein n=1 Tax=Microcoleus sp. herbarium8 TaxID=3055436 RepID=UPI002FD316EE
AKGGDKNTVALFFEIGITRKHNLITLSRILDPTIPLASLFVSNFPCDLYSTSSSIVENVISRPQPFNKTPFAIFVNLKISLNTSILPTPDTPTSKAKSEK